MSTTDDEVGEQPDRLKRLSQVSIFLCVLALLIYSWTYIKQIKDDLHQAHADNGALVRQIGDLAGQVRSLGGIPVVTVPIPTESPPTTTTSTRPRTASTTTQPGAPPTTAPAPTPAPPSTTTTTQPAPTPSTICILVVCTR